ncbi:MAG: NUDIX hydrolase, partial [Acetatifactor sp.]|nr:NUDIX hydrolase [Acetatifactor sp.]
EVSPGKWEIGAGVSAIKGESPLEGACRELREETGIEAAGNLQEIYRVVHRGHHAIYHGYLLVTDWPKNRIVLQEGETISYRWLSREEFVDFYDNGLPIGSQKSRLEKFVEGIRFGTVGAAWGGREGEK